MNGVVFLVYVLQILLPTLRLGDLVIMDNLSAQKGEAVCAPVIAAGYAGFAAFVIARLQSD